jgi:hypothetical protein
MAIDLPSGGSRCHRSSLLYYLKALGVFVSEIEIEVAGIAM